jgi:hypothetical protein
MNGLLRKKIIIELISLKNNIKIEDSFESRASLS